MNNYYLYVLLDPRKPGLYKYQDLKFSFEPFYVGISKFERRYLEHLNESQHSNKKSPKCYKIRKIKTETGKDPIVIKLFENLTKEDVISLEKEFIKKIGRSILKTGPLTNLTSGGDGGDTHTNNPKLKEIIKKQSLAVLGEKNPFYGKKHSEETKKKISERTKAEMKKLSPRTQEQMQERNKKISVTLTGRKYSKERRENISKSLKGKTHRDKGKKKKTISCPFCFREGSISMMKRWHFNNCKEKNNEGFYR